MSMLVIWGRDASVSALVKDNFYNPSLLEAAVFACTRTCGLLGSFIPPVCIACPSQLPSRPAESTNASSSQTRHVHPERSSCPHDKTHFSVLISQQIQGLHHPLLPSPLVSWWPGSALLSLSRIPPAIVLNYAPLLLTL